MTYQISDVLSFSCGRILSLGVDGELYAADPSLVHELQFAATGDEKAYAWECMRRAVINPDLFCWKHWDVGSPIEVSDKLRQEAREKYSWPLKAGKTLQLA
jgi:hypothetical protein